MLGWGRWRLSRGREVATVLLGTAIQGMFVSSNLATFAHSRCTRSRLTCRWSGDSRAHVQRRRRRVMNTCPRMITWRWCCKGRSNTRPSLSRLCSLVLVEFVSPCPPSCLRPLSPSSADQDKLIGIVGAPWVRGQLCVAGDVEGAPHTQRDSSVVIVSAWPQCAAAACTAAA